MGQHAEGAYYVPHGTRWPILGSIGMCLMLSSTALWLHGSGAAFWTVLAGAAIIIYMVFGWFAQVIRES
jgi:cytochrome c oxidase subunit 3